MHGRLCVRVGELHLSEMKTLNWRSLFHGNKGYKKLLLVVVDYCHSEKKEIKKDTVLEKKN